MASVTASQAAPVSDRRRWIALVVVCLAQLMSVLDSTIVNVALPSIQRDLDFTQANLTWVVNAYLITFGSFLLMAGRLGDLVGRKKVFLAGVTIFTLASGLCALAQDQTMLIAARFLQGLGAAVSVSVILALIVTEFTSPLERAKAMSAYMFVVVSGGSIGLLTGGLLTESINWHWVFVINLPIGVATMVLGSLLLDENEGLGLRRGVDVVGTILVTVALAVGVYAIVTSTEHGWGSAHTLGFGGAAVLLLGAFLALQARLANPMMPLRILRIRSLMGSSVVRTLFVPGMFSAFFLGALYLEHVRGFDALDTGLAFLPLTVAVGVLSLGITARLVGRFGPLRVLVPGLLMVIAGLLLLASAGADTAYFPTVFIAFAILGLGAGSSFMPLLTLAMADVPQRDAGLGSGIANVSVQVAGALGLAVLGTVATNRTAALTDQGESAASALTGGYHLAFLVAAGCVAVGIVMALVLLRTAHSREPAVEAEPEPA